MVRWRTMGAADHAHRCVRLRERRAAVRLERRIDRRDRDRPTSCGRPGCRRGIQHHGARSRTGHGTLDARAVASRGNLDDEPRVQRLGHRPGAQRDRGWSAARQSPFPVGGGKAPVGESSDPDERPVDERVRRHPLRCARRADRIQRTRRVDPHGVGGKPDDAVRAGSRPRRSDQLRVRRLHQGDDLDRHHDRGAAGGRVARRRDPHDVGQSLRPDDRPALRLDR